MGRPELPPILLHEVQTAGLALEIRCPICSRTASIPAREMPLPHDFDMNAIGHRLRCTGCGRRGGINVYPHHKGWVRYLRQTGQRERLPWFAPMIRDED